MKKLKEINLKGNFKPMIMVKSTFFPPQLMMIKINTHITFRDEL